MSQWSGSSKTVGDKGHPLVLVPTAQSAGMAELQACLAGWLLLLLVQLQLLR